MWEPRARGEPGWRWMPRSGPTESMHRTHVHQLAHPVRDTRLDHVGGAGRIGRVGQTFRVGLHNHACGTVHDRNPPPRNAGLSESASRTSTSCVCTAAAKPAGRARSLPLCTTARTAASRLQQAVAHMLSEEPGCPRHRDRLDISHDSAAGRHAVLPANLPMLSGLVRNRRGPAVQILNVEHGQGLAGRTVAPFRCTQGCR